jgi:hypothetical protein
MSLIHPNRRTLLTATGAALVTGVSGLRVPAQAKTIAPSKTMRGGANNYRAGAPVVDKIGGGGFWMSGTVRRAGDGAPLAGQRIQIWAHTTEGHERLEMPQIVPAFGQAHGHLAYDSAEFKKVFLRPVMKRSSDTSLEAHFVLEPV